MKKLYFVLVAVLVIGAALFINNKVSSDARKSADITLCESEEGIPVDAAEIAKCASLGVPAYVDQAPQFYYGK